MVTVLPVSTALYQNISHVDEMSSEWATPTHMDRLAMILVNAKRGSVQSQSPGISAHGVLRRLLRDAQFWELPKLRGASVL